MTWYSLNIITGHLVFSTFTFRPTSLVVRNRFSVFLFAVSVFTRWLINEINISYHVKHFRWCEVLDIVHRPIKYKIAFTEQAFTLCTCLSHSFNSSIFFLFHCEYVIQYGTALHLWQSQSLMRFYVFETKFFKYDMMITLCPVVSEGAECFRIIALQTKSRWSQATLRRSSP